MDPRLAQFSLGAEMRFSAEGVAEVNSAMREQPGHVRAEFFPNDAAGVYDFIAVWNSKFAAQVVYPIFYPVFSASAEAAGCDGTPYTQPQKIEKPKG